MYIQVISRLACLWLLLSTSALASPIILETFEGYPDDALISADHAGPATGLEGNWYLNTESNFYVNRTEEDLEAGFEKAVYDFPGDDNGMREAYRLTDDDHILFDENEDVFYASFLIEPARVMGRMIFTLHLDRINGGGQSEVSFGMKNGHFVAAANVYGPTPPVREMLVVLRVKYLQKGRELVTLWVDPTDESSAPEINNVPVDLLSRGGGILTAVSIRGERMAGQPAFFDNLRVGLAFEDVTYDLQQPVLSRDIGMNGLFYDPDNPGHGFNFVVHEDGLTVLYMGHTAGGMRLWLQSTLFGGDLNFNEDIVLNMYEVINGTFGHPLLPKSFWGTITINLANCDSGQATFDGLVDGAMTMDFTRLTSLPGIDCQH
jgi:hypothetical protein